MSETNYNECANAIVFGSPARDEIDKNGGVQINVVPVYQKDGQEARFGMQRNLKMDIFTIYSISLWEATNEETESVAAFLEYVSQGNKIVRMVFFEGAKGEGPVVDGKGPSNCVTCFVYLEKNENAILGDYFTTSEISEFAVEGRVCRGGYEIVEDANSYTKSPEFKADKRLWEVVFVANSNNE